MNLTLKGSNFKKRTIGFLSPKLRKAPIKFREKELSPDDSKRTLIDNRSISQSFNSSILSMNLRSHSYKRAESELKEILRKADSPKGQITLNKVARSLSKTIKLTAPKMRIRKTDSTFSPEEADLIIDEYRVIRKPKLWKTIISNYKSNPKQLMDLIPVSLKSHKKADTSKSSTIKKSSVSPKIHNQNSSKRLLSNNFHFPFQFTSPISSPSNLDTVETLKKHKKRLTDDWSKSLLLYNIKHKIKPEVMTQETLENLMKKLPSEEADLEKVHADCMETLEGLLTEMLGTHQDFVQFQNAYNVVVPSILRMLIGNCLKLMSLRKATEEILEGIIKREEMIKGIETATKKEIIEIYKLSKDLRGKIEDWLKQESVPFRKFMFKSKDYLEKMNEDLVVLQPALYAVSRRRAPIRD